MEQDDGTPKAADSNRLVIRPVIVDLGKKSKKSIRDLERGKGKAMSEVEEAIHQVRARLSEADKAKETIPIILIYERKRKRVSLPSLPLPPLNLFR